MKIETTIELSEEVLKALEQTSGPDDRSQVVEAAIWAYIRHARHQARAERDLEILNRNAEELNEEAADVLEYQVNW
jgi:hypothetical protein